MKPFWRIFTPATRRSLVYKTFGRLVTGFTLALVWNRFFNAEKRLSLAEHAFFVLGIVFFALAWLSYLKLDGVKIPFLGGPGAKKRVKHKTGQMLDFIEEDSGPAKPLNGEDELNEKEAALSSLFANLAAGLCFILPSVFAALF